MTIVVAAVVVVGVVLGVVLVIVLVTGVVVVMTHDATPAPAPAAPASRPIGIRHNRHHHPGAQSREERTHLMVSGAAIITYNPGECVWVCTARKAAEEVTGRICTAERLI